MAKRLTVEPATQAHAALLAEHLRPEDAAEMKASHGLEPAEGVRMALEVTPDARVILDGERVVAILGAVRVSDTAASVWLLAARGVKRVKLAFMRAAAAELERLSKQWALLFNFVWAENQGALRWVEALGFDVMAPVEFGASGLPFHPIRFVRRS